MTNIQESIQIKKLLKIRLQMEEMMLRKMLQKRKKAFGKIIKRKRVKKKCHEIKIAKTQFVNALTGNGINTSSRIGVKCAKIRGAVDAKTKYKDVDTKEKEGEDNEKLRGFEDDGDENYMKTKITRDRICRRLEESLSEDDVANEEKNTWYGEIRRRV